MYKNNSVENVSRYENLAALLWSCEKICIFKISFIDVPANPANTKSVWHLIDFEKSKNVQTDHTNITGQQELQF